MSDGRDPDVTRLLRDLTRELQTLQRELEPDSRGPLPDPSDLSRFTSEVAIPGIILILETNIRALQLLRRTIRLADGRDPRTTTGSTASEVRDRAEQLGQSTLAQLDSALAEVQNSLETDGDNDEAQELLTEARQLQDQIRAQLADDRSGTDDDSTEIGIENEETDAVDIDVDAELRTIKDNLDDEPRDDGDEDDDGAGGEES